MNHSARLLIAATLIFAAGCAKQDWIDRTLVTVDVTGTWSGSIGGRNGIDLELEQQGSTVKGLVRFPEAPGTSTGIYRPGPIEGTLAGDVFRFRDSRGNLEGEVTVSGDEMNGLISFYGQKSLSLRRVDPSSPPASPPR
jgi:hypothetical protein